jgi:hypothetical protein
MTRTPTQPPLVRPTFAVQPQGDPRAWAHRLKAREERGEQLSRVQMAAWREALRGPAVPIEPTEDPR